MNILLRSGRSCPFRRIALALAVLVAGASPLLAVPSQYYMDERGNELLLLEDDEVPYGTLRVAAPSRTMLITGDLMKEGNQFWFTMPDEAALNQDQEPDSGWKVAGTVDSAKNSAQIKVERYGPKVADERDKVPPSQGLYRRVKADERLRRAQEENKRAEEDLLAAKERVRGVNHPGLKQILESEAAWNDERVEAARMVAEGIEEQHPPTEVPDYWHTMAELGRMRAQLLIAASGIAAQEGPNGDYLDDSGGSLAVSAIRGDAPKTLRFQISVVRGPTSHTGALSGVATFTEPDLAVFIDTNKDAFEDGEPATLRFRFQGHELIVEAEHTSYYHGARAYFDGTYYRLPE